MKIYIFLTLPSPPTQLNHCWHDYHWQRCVQLTSVAGVDVVVEHFVMFHLRGKFIIRREREKNGRATHVRYRCIALSSLEVRVIRKHKGCINFAVDYAFWNTVRSPHQRQRRRKIYIKSSYVNTFGLFKQKTDKLICECKYVYSGIANTHANLERLEIANGNAAAFH